MNPLHVVLLKSNVQHAGGLEKYASRIANAFVAKGAKVSLLTTGVPTKWLSPLEIHSVTTCSWPPFRRMEDFDRFTASWLAQHPADLVFGMDRNRFQTHIRAGNGVHAAYLKSRIHTEGRLKWLSCLCNPMHRKILSLERSAFEHPALRLLFTNSHMVKKEILARYRIDPSKIEVIHNGVEWTEMESDFLSWPEQKPILLRTHQLHPDRFHFLFVGNGYLRKGLFPLLHALARLPTRDFQLSVVGKERHQALYQKEVERIGLTHHVHFFGAQSDIRPFYQYADALVIPSFYDPFANVTVEALAMGLFVVSSRQNGGHEILTPAHGMIVDTPQEIEALSHALSIALQHAKSKQSAALARSGVQHLDFSKQLSLLIERCITS